MSMVQIEVGRRRRLDAVTGAAIVLTVDAVLFLAITVVGAPFLAFFAADETGVDQRITPLVIGWLTSCVLGVACAVAAVRFARGGETPAYRLGAVAAGGATVATVALIVASIRESPGLAAVALLFAAPNVVAALILLNPDRAVAVTDRLVGRLPALLRSEAEPLPADDEPDEPGTDWPEYDELDVAELEAAATDPENTRATVDLVIRRTARDPAPRQRSRGPAAMRTLDGVRLPPRARRGR